MYYKYVVVGVTCRANHGGKDCHVLDEKVLVIEKGIISVEMFTIL